MPLSSPCFTAGMIFFSWNALFGFCHTEKDLVAESRLGCENQMIIVHLRKQKDKDRRRHNRHQMRTFRLQTGKTKGFKYTGRVIRETIRENQGSWDQSRMQTKAKT